MINVAKSSLRKCFDIKDLAEKVYGMFSSKRDQGSVPGLLQEGNKLVISGYDVAVISSLCEQGSVPSSGWQGSKCRKELRHS